MYASIRIRKEYFEVLKQLGDVNAIAESAIRKYVIDLLIKRIEISKKEVNQFEKKYSCDYTTFAERISDVVKSNPTWEEDFIEWEYWSKELQEWTKRLENTLLKL
ncbi:MAG: hypothetical protein ACE5KE_12655 [Methanosarcinales archaeon]